MELAAKTSVEEPELPAQYQSTYRQDYVDKELPLAETLGRRVMMTQNMQDIKVAQPSLEGGLRTLLAPPSARAQRLDSARLHGWRLCRRGGCLTLLFYRAQGAGDGLWRKEADICKRSLVMEATSAPRPTLRCRPAVGVTRSATPCFALAPWLAPRRASRRPRASWRP